MPKLMGFTASCGCTSSRKSGSGCSRYGIIILTIQSSFFTFTFFLQGNDGDEFDGVVVGVTAQGFLRVRASDTGEVMEAMPDGNSFDMMHGLITIRKTRM